MGQACISPSPGVDALTVSQGTGKAPVARNAVARPEWLRYTTYGAYSIQQLPCVVQPRCAQVDCRLFSLKDFPD